MWGTQLRSLGFPLEITSLLCPRELSLLVEHHAEFVTNCEASACPDASLAKQGGDGVALFEEFDRQDCGQAPENIEIIPFDNVSPRRGGDDASEVCWNALSRSNLPCDRRQSCGELRDNCPPVD